MTGRITRTCRLLVVTLAAAALHATPTLAAGSPPDGVVTWGASARSMSMGRA